MGIKRLIDKAGILSPDDRKEFNNSNSEYNSGVTIFLSVIVAVLLCFSMVAGYLTYKSGAEGVGEFRVVLPYHIACIIMSIAVLVIMVFIRKRNMSHHLLSDVVAIAQVCMIMLLFLISSHIEIPVIGIKNINALIILMFVIGFFLRFRIVVTLALEVIFTAAAIIFLIIERNDISNFYPSVVNVFCAFVLASFSAIMYWFLRKSNFMSTKKLELLASSDHLTRLHNRRGFDAYIEREWIRAKNEKLCLSLLFIDVDNFKKFNDIYGHVAGDRCLCAIADSLAASIRKNDFAARYGGEEFVVSLTGANAEIVDRIAGKMIDAMREQNIPHSDSVAPYVTISIGCMICPPSKRAAIDLEAFIMMADDALYMAKDQGRNRIVIHPDALK